MKRILIALLALGLLLTACAPGAEVAEPPVEAPTEASVAAPTAEEVSEPEPETTEMVFTDGLGRTITLDGYAQSIVTLGPSSLENLFAIGAGDQVVGREEYSIYPEDALEITSVGSLFGEFPLEAILALEPDLVIAPQIVAEENIQSLVDLGLQVYWMENPVNFEGLYENLRLLAQMTGHEEAAESLIADLETRVKAVEEVIAYVESNPSVLYELDATDPMNPWTTGSGTFVDTLIRMAGGTNAAAEMTGDYAQISSEAVIAANPEVILLADAPYGITPESVAERAGWDVIAAVENGQVFAFDPYLVSVPGPRMVEGLKAIAELLHPDSFD